MRFFKFGTRRDDDLTVDDGDRRIFTGKGDDTLTYNHDEDGGMRRYFNGGRGDDTLVVELTQAQWDDPAVQEEFVAFYDHVEHTGSSWWGRMFQRPFHFETIDISVRRVENLTVSIDGVTFDPRDPPVIETGAQDDVFVVSADLINPHAVGSTDPNIVNVGNVLDNDGEGAALAGQIRLFDENGDNSWGHADLLPDGTLSFAPYEGITGHERIDDLQEGEQLTFTGEYTNVDGTTATVSLVVEGVNDPTYIRVNGSIYDAGYEPSTSASVIDPDNDVVSAVLIDDPTNPYDDVLVFDLNSGRLSVDMDLAASEGIVIGDEMVDFTLQVTLDDGTVSDLDASVNVRNVGSSVPPPPPPPPAAFVDDIA
ncbi:MAG: VCBS domain-containing protein [Pelagimonas sp.]|uniref:VCBS domain-containing protein n=1 Tax=Pelagimonas sp. TaxID=2073170 RepID=UPI003D6C0F7E